MPTFKPNSSSDHLLGPAPSVRSSRPASVYSSASIDTLVAAGQPQGYRGYPSQEAYLLALQEWVDSKLYFESDVQLRGWYGTKTKDHYLSKTSVFEERRARKREEREEESQRRATVARLGVVHEEEGDGEERDVGGVKEKKESKLRRVFGRRNTVV